jgi:large conductance mechanosensitive channel
MVQGFLKFLKEYNVLGLAIAVIIGGKLNEFINSLVQDLLMPLLFRPALEAAHVNSIRELSYKGILYGKVLGSGVDFLIVALVVYCIAKWVLRQPEVKKI